MDQVDFSNRTSKSAPSRFDTNTETTASFSTPFHFAADESLSIDTSMDGIDILAAEPPPENFLQYTHQQTGRIVTSITFKRMAFCVIMINTLFIGLRTQEQVRENDVLLLICNSVVRGCLLFFTGEVILTIIHFQGKVVLRGWIMLDIAIILASWLILTTMSIFRGFRLIRSLRKATGLQVVRETVRALLKAIPRLVSLTGMFIIVLFMFSVFFTDLQLNNRSVEADGDAAEEQEHYFKSVIDTTQTLLQIVSGGRLWYEITADLESTNPGTPILVVCFIFIAVILYGGMSVAIFVNALMSVTKEHLSFRSSPVSAWRADNEESQTTMQTIIEEKPVSSTHALEKKVTDLTNTIQQLLGMQAALQQSIQLLNDRQTVYIDRLSTGNLSKDDLSWQTPKEE